jgi:hypothetical protein
MEKGGHWGEGGGRKGGRTYETEGRERVTGRRGMG